MPEQSPQDILDVNVRYHDLASESYDSKWGIDYGAKGAAQVLAKMQKALGQPLRPMGRGLEIGAGTGYFSLNLLQAGVVKEAVATDISPGMLVTLNDNARRLGLAVETKAADAEALPFPDDSFDLVFGHAVLHHLPDLDQAFREFLRVLRPGGTFVFAGEPSRTGDKLANVPKRGAVALAPLWRSLLRARPASDPGGHGDADPSLGEIVDVHAFVPDELARHAHGAGFADVHVRGEELLANWFGWTNRTLESTAEPEDVPMAWRQYAYHGYLFFQAVDRRLLETRLPAAIFYNLMISGRKPIQQT
ncbi:MAG: Methyltransferase type 11 [Solirubrobacterales bacterium]|nr:Methyltransferase type 11 [Solirubrobacterales bacterium]